MSSSMRAMKRGRTCSVVDCDGDRPMFARCTAGPVVASWAVNYGWLSGGFLEQKRLSIAPNGSSPAVWDHTVLRDIRQSQHKWKCSPDRPVLDLACLPKWDGRLSWPWCWLHMVYLSGSRSHDLSILTLWSPYQPKWLQCADSDSASGSQSAADLQCSVLLPHSADAVDR